MDGFTAARPMSGHPQRLYGISGSIQYPHLALTVRLIHQQSTADARYRRLMEYAKLETAALAHVDDSYYYGAYCRKCKHAGRLSLEKLRNHLGDNFPLRKVKDRLRCERCSSRQIVITFLAPNQKTGNAVYLFSQLPRN
jgi:hypothetical protein